MSRLRSILSGLLTKRAKVSRPPRRTMALRARQVIKESHVLRGVRRHMESTLPLAAPVFTHLLDRPLDRARSNGNGHTRRISRPRRKNPLAMVLGFTLPIGNGRGSSRLHIRTFFRLER